MDASTLVWLGVPGPPDRARGLGLLRWPRREEHQAVLMLGAVTFHKVPEALAAGVAFAGWARSSELPSALRSGGRWSAS